MNEKQNNWLHKWNALFERSLIKQINNNKNIYMLNKTIFLTHYKYFNKGYSEKCTFFKIIFLYDTTIKKKIYTFISTSKIYKITE